MGKFEKLVLLTVLFVTAVVLAVSLNRGKKEEGVQAAGPLDAADRLMAGKHEGGLPETTYTPPSEGGILGQPEASLLLDAGSDPATPGAPPAETITPPSQEPLTPTLSLEKEFDPSRPILLADAGLRPSFLDDYMVYTLAEGDTWSTLAQRFYQDGRYTRNLIQANDGLQVLVPGKEILVPIHDFMQPAAGLQSAPGAAEFAIAPADAPAAKSVDAPVTSAADRTGPATPATPSTRGGEYEVRAGDTLSEISLAVFGTASRWKELLDANKDKLSSPEGLQVGMKLKIPPGGKVPVVAKGDAKKPATAAKKPEAAPAEAPPKKKKVL